MRKLIFLFVLITITIQGLAQKTQAPATGQLVTLSCTYKMSFRPDSTSTNIITENTQLLIAKDFSEFRSVNRFKRDSLKSMTVSKANAYGMSDAELSSSITGILKAPAAKVSYLIYKIPSKGQCLVYDNILSLQYKYEEDSKSFNWVITPAKEVIAGYTCQKAITVFAGRSYEAWFTREIPISDGPYKFNGLPGLIIKVKDTGNNYTFELVSLTKPTQQYTIGLPVQPAITTTKREFLQAARAARENVVDRAAQYGTTFKNPEEIRARHREKMKRENNPLELQY